MRPVPMQMVDVVVVGNEVDVLAVVVLFPIPDKCVGSDATQAHCTGHFITCDGEVIIDPLMPGMFEQLVNMPIFANKVHVLTVIFQIAG